MIGSIIAGVCGLVIGLALTLALALVMARKHTCPDPDAHKLRDGDREAVAAEFALHTAAVRQQVSEYADVLAGGDVELRERLRRFEAGALS